MFVRFEDWSKPMFIEVLESKGLSHTDKIIKAFATETDPRQDFNLPGLTVVESDGTPFGDGESYTYDGRGEYIGPGLEDTLADCELDSTGLYTVRSLFRFSNRYGYCQAAMKAKKGDQWLIDHPFEDVDGLALARSNPARSRAIHLDIFFPESLESLKNIVDYENPDRVLDAMQSIRLQRR